MAGEGRRSALKNNIILNQHMEIRARRVDSWWNFTNFINYSIIWLKYLKTIFFNEVGVCMQNVKLYCNTEPNCFLHIID